MSETKTDQGMRIPPRSSSGASMRKSRCSSIRSYVYAAPGRSVEGETFEISSRFHRIHQRVIKWGLTRSGDPQARMLDSRCDAVAHPEVCRASARRVLGGHPGRKCALHVAHQPGLGNAMAHALPPGVSRNPVALSAAVRRPHADLCTLHGDLWRPDRGNVAVGFTTGDA